MNAVARVGRMEQKAGERPGMVGEFDALVRVWKGSGAGRIGLWSAGRDQRKAVLAE